MAGSGSEVVTIVTPFRNASQYFSSYTRSLLSQSYEYLEPILVDDESSSQEGIDEMLSILMRKFGKTKYIRLNKNEGPARARNEAIIASSGKYIAFLDIDDFWLPEKLALQVSELSNKAIHGCCTAYMPFCGRSGLAFRPICPPKKISRAEIRRGNPIGNLTAVICGNRCRALRFPEWELHEDYGFWTRYINAYGPMIGLPKVTALYRIGSQSFSSKKARVFPFMVKAYRRYLEQGIDDAVIHALHHSAKGGMKACVRIGVEQFR